MNNAQRITKRMQETNRQRGKDSIYAVVSDDHCVHCLTEAHLDVWWESLKPEDKAAVYELHLDGALDPDSPAEAQIEINYSSNLLFIAGMSTIVDAARIMAEADRLKAEHLIQGGRQQLAERGVYPMIHVATVTDVTLRELVREHRDNAGRARRIVQRPQDEKNYADRQNAWADIYQELLDRRRESTHH